MISLTGLVGLLLAASAVAQERGAARIENLRGVIDAYRSSHAGEIVEDFMALLSLPNVADDLADMARNAEHLTELLEARGFVVRTLEAGGAPYLYAELEAEGASDTLMIYAHYDGQPVLEDQWTYPPFSPVLLDGALWEGGEPVDWRPSSIEFEPNWRIYGRSAGDDKLPIIALLHALDALEANGIPISVNIKLLLDGEEEQGSPTLGPLLDRYGQLLEADLMLFCDGPMHQSRRQQLVFGVRGTMSVDLTAFGASRPLHSGHYGNWAPNPVMQLAYLLTSMRDPDGRILVADYYDDVAPLTDLELAAIAEMPDMRPELQDDLSINAPEGDGARLEELIALPAINARGFEAGGVGDKGSNIILSRATVSLDLRMVPNQTPAMVRQRIESHIESQGFHIVTEDPEPEELRQHARVLKVDWGRGYPALRTRLDDPSAARLIGVMRTISPDLILTPTMGGSLPLFEFGTRLSAPIVILPLANHDNNQHGEDENVRLDNLWNAISVLGIVLATYATE